jgi:hypothetical protein
MDLRGGMVWIGLIRLRIEINGGLFVNTVVHLRVP